MKIANKQLCTRPVDAWHLFICAGCCIVSHQQQYCIKTVLIWVDYQTLWVHNHPFLGNMFKKCHNVFLCFQGKPPPTSFVSDPDPGDSSNNSKTTLTRTASNQYSEGRFWYTSLIVVTVRGVWFIYQWGIKKERQEGATYWKEDTNSNAFMFDDGIVQLQ